MSDPDDFDRELPEERLRRIQALLETGLDERAPAGGRAKAPPKTYRQALVRGLRVVADHQPDALVQGLRRLARREEG